MDARRTRRWLQVALTDRFAAIWVLAATTGMRRSELAGIERNALDLDNGTLTIEATRVVVGGHAEDSDGKSDAGVREISLDPFTMRLLRDYVATLDKEREAFGKSYPDHRKLMCFEDGRRLHANMNVTFQIYAHRSTGRDRAAAQAIADLIRAALPIEYSDEGPADG